MNPEYTAKAFAIDFLSLGDTLILLIYSCLSSITEYSENALYSISGIPTVSNNKL